VSNRGQAQFQQSSNSADSPKNLSLAPFLETERLSLRELTVDDAEFVIAQLNDPEFIRNVADRGVRTAAAARAYILDGPVASYRRNGFGLLLVERKARPIPTPIGICGLIKRESLDDIDLGYAFLPRFRSQGYALEAASAVMAFARITLGLARVVAIVSPSNTDSIRLLRKLGFRRERQVRLADDAEELALFASAPPNVPRHRGEQ
jgi:[ribosomal protein S5]-alanine N-acetyltransferase